MKLENFHAVAELIKERDHLEGLLLRVRSDADVKLTIKCPMQSNADIRPDVVERMLPEMRMIIAQAVAAVEEKLAALGVSNGKAAA